MLMRGASWRELRALDFSAIQGPEPQEKAKKDSKVHLNAVFLQSQFSPIRSLSLYLVSFVFNGNRNRRATLERNISNTSAERYGARTTAYFDRTDYAFYPLHLLLELRAHFRCGGA